MLISPASLARIFSYLKHLPPVRTQPPPIPFIALHVRSPLLRPERLIRRGRGFAIFAAMNMPEAAVNEQHRFYPREDEIRLARQILHVQPVAKSHAMQQSPDAHFRLRISSVDARHVQAALLGRVDVGHRAQHWPAGQRLNSER
jgi:hypothetical protein